jgi:hypothetical protein
VDADQVETFEVTGTEATSTAVEVDTRHSEADCAGARHSGRCGVQNKLDQKTQFWMKHARWRRLPITVDEAET